MKISLCNLYSVILAFIICIPNPASAVLLGRVNAYYAGDGSTIVDPTSDAVKKGFGDTAQIITNPGSGKSSVAYKAYQYNLILMDKDRVKSKDGKDGKDKEAAVKTTFDKIDGTGNDEVAALKNEIKRVHYGYSIPMYIFLKLPSSLSTDMTSLSNDLLDNEHGGVLNIKLSGGEKLFRKAFFNHRKDDIPDGGSDYSGYGLSWVYDGGVKLFGTPTSTTTSQNTFSSAGYLGTGFNFEFPIRDVARVQV